MAKEENSELITFRILRVKDTAFTINENFYLNDKSPTDIKVSVNCELKTNIDVNLIIVEIFAFYYYDTLVENQLASIIVQTAFNITDLKNYETEQRLKLPPHFLVTLVSISLSHTRALFSKNIDGTAFNGMIMPLINPEEFSKSIFPEIFNGTGLSLQDRTKESQIVIPEKLEISS